MKRSLSKSMLMTALITGSVLAGEVMLLRRKP